MSCRTNVKYNIMLNCVSVHTAMEIYWILALLTTGRSLDFLLMQLHICIVKECFCLLFIIVSLVYIYIYIYIYVCICVYVYMYVCVYVSIMCMCV